MGCWEQYLHFLHPKSSSYSIARPSLARGGSIPAACCPRRVAGCREWNDFSISNSRSPSKRGDYRIHMSTYFLCTSRFLQTRLLPSDESLDLRRLFATCRIARKTVVPTKPVMAPHKFYIIGLAHQHSYSNTRVWYFTRSSQWPPIKRSLVRYADSRRLVEMKEVRKGHDTMCP